MQIEVDDDEISIIDTTIKKRDMHEIQIDGRILLNDEDFDTTDIENIDSRNDCSMNKR